MIEDLERITAAGGTVEVVGRDIRLRVPKGLLSEAERRLLAEHKAEIVRLLTNEPVDKEPPLVGGSTTLNQRVQNGHRSPPHNSYNTTRTNAGKTVSGSTIEADLDLDEEVVVPPPPCPQCGGFLAWWDFSGRPHCMTCDPADRSEKLRRQAERLRRQARRANPFPTVNKRT